MVGRTSKDCVATGGQSVQRIAQRRVGLRVAPGSLSARRMLSTTRSRGLLVLFGGSTGTSGPVRLSEPYTWKVRIKNTLRKQKRSTCPLQNHAYASLFTL